MGTLNALAAIRCSASTNSAICQFGDLEGTLLREGQARSAAHWRNVLEPIVKRYQSTPKRYFRGDAGFAKPEIYEYLEQQGYRYAIRLPANNILHSEIAFFLKRPVGRPPRKPIICFTSFEYQAATWDKPRRVVAKVEWHQGEMFPRVGFVVTNLSEWAGDVVWFATPVTIAMKQHDGTASVLPKYLSGKSRLKYGFIRLMRIQFGGSPGI